MGGAIHFVGGGLSRVGKSVVTRALVDYAHPLVQKMALFDADPYKSDIAPFYPASRRLILQQELMALDEWVEVASQGATVLINLPERAEQCIADWIQTNNLSVVAGELGLRFCYWWVSDGSTESLELLSQQLATWGSWMPHILVKNAHFCEYWSNGGESEWQAKWIAIRSQSWYQEAVKTGAILGIEFPKLYWVEMGRLTYEPMSFSAAINQKEFFAMTRSRYFRFVEDYKAAFKSTLVFERLGDSLESVGELTEELVSAPF